MKNRKEILRILYIAGVVALVVGALDPMEGSVVVATGSVLTAVATHMLGDRHRSIFLVLAAMIVTGVGSLWFVSSLGGFNPKTEWWWLVAIAPYPLGWLAAVVTLIFRAVRRRKLATLL